MYTLSAAAPYGGVFITFQHVQAAFTWDFVWRQAAVVVFDDWTALTWSQNGHLDHLDRVLFRDLVS